MNYWIFKCNPENYALDARLADPEPCTTWLVSRYRDEIRKGDIAFIWQTGKERGLRAVLQIETDPEEMAEFSYEQKYLREPDTKLRIRVVGTYIQRFPVILGRTLKAIEELQGMSVFRGFNQATNYRLTPTEGEHIERLTLGTG